MTMNPHTSAAIAQLVFYIPMLPIAIYLMIANWGFGPRMAWYPPTPYAMIRIASGVMIIIEGQNPTDRGIVIATMVLLNIGLVPIVMSFLGIVRLILESNFKGHKRLKTFIIVIRYNILGAVGLLSTAGGLIGQTDKAHTQSTLSKVAMIQFICIILALVILCMVLYFPRRHQIRESEMIYLRWALIACLPLTVRLAYGLVSVFDATGNNVFTSMWSPLFGSPAAFALMSLLPEYITVCIYLGLGFHRFRTGRREQLEEPRRRRRGSHHSDHSRLQDVSVNHRDHRNV